MIDTSAVALTASTQPVTTPALTAEERLAKFKAMLSLEQAAEAVGRHPGTVKEWIRLGLPHVKLPGRRGRVLIDKQDLADWCSGKLMPKAA